MRSLEACFITGFVAIFLPSSVVFAVQNFDVPWSPKQYGPDGPWQAVTITLGGLNTTRTIGTQNHSDIDVYPGGTWETYSLTPAACQSYPNSICGSGGLWEPDPNDLSNLTAISQGFTRDEPSYGLNISFSGRTYMATTIAGKTVYNSTQAYVETGKMIYPSGKIGGITLGGLSLGAEATSQFFTLDPKKVHSGITAWTFPGGLYDNGEIPSYSFGLHIGSAAFNYPGSLVFGGYNKGRVIDPVTSFKSESTVDLLDIGIGVEDGDSPFPFTNKSGLFLDSSGQTQRRNVTIDPLNPYLALPGRTCDGLAKLLPVTFNVSLKYYTWNVNDLNYKKIVAPPAYLSFTFPPPPGSSNVVVIKVPFALLNLTLERPITNTPTQYFPCLPFDSDSKPPVLGRAFLQTAFFGRNWGTGYSWLAQAPGPGASVSANGLGDSRTDIARDAIMIEGYKNSAGTNLFNQTWAGHWSSAASHVSVTPTPTPSLTVAPPHKGLSTGAMAGIGVGAAIAAIAVLAAAVLLWRRKNRTEGGTTGMDSAEPYQDVKTSQELYRHNERNLPEFVGPAGTERANFVNPSAPVEAPYRNPPTPTEIPDSNDPRMR